MIALYLGKIPLGLTAPTGPTGQSITQANTLAQYDVTRGKPVLHQIGEELDTQTLDFFFSEEFCAPLAELAKLERAFKSKTPLPLMVAGGGYSGKRYVVETLDQTVQKTNRLGVVVRVEASMTLLEAPVTSTRNLFSSIALALAPALIGIAANNPNLRR